MDDENQYVQDFVDEAIAALGVVDELLVKLETDANDRAALDSVFRAKHDQLFRARNCFGRPTG